MNHYGTFENETRQIIHSQQSQVADHQFSQLQQDYSQQTLHSDDPVHQSQLTQLTKLLDAAFHENLFLRQQLRHHQDQITELQETVAELESELEAYEGCEDNLSQDFESDFFINARDINESEEDEIDAVENRHYARTLLMCDSEELFIGR